MARNNHRTRDRLAVLAVETAAHGKRQGSGTSIWGCSMDNPGFCGVAMRGWELEDGVVGGGNPSAPSRG
jgi:hypothetical protein